MSGGIFDWSAVGPPWLWLFLRPFLAAAGTGLAIKLMDDMLDSHLDRVRGLRNLADRLGRAAMPYGLLALALGLYADPRLGLALFLAAYAVGMAGRPFERLPLGLRAWQEMIIAAVLLWLLAGWHQGGQLLLLLLSIQLWDDVLDRGEGLPPGPWAWVSRASRPISLLLALACLLAAFALGPLLALAVVLAACLVWAVSGKRRWLGHARIGLVGRGDQRRRLR